MTTIPENSGANDPEAIEPTTIEALLQRRRRKEAPRARVVRLIQSMQSPATWRDNPWGEVLHGLTAGLEPGDAAGAVADALSILEFWQTHPGSSRALLSTAILPPVGASGSAAFEQPSFSSQAKAPLHRPNSLELDIPAPGSIESPWDAGSIWDGEASAYDLTQSTQQ